MYWFFLGRVQSQLLFMSMSLNAIITYSVKMFLLLLALLLGFLFCTLFQTYWENQYHSDLALGSGDKTEVYFIIRGFTLETAAEKWIWLKNVFSAVEEYWAIFTCTKQRQDSFTVYTPTNWRIWARTYNIEF